MQNNKNTRMNQGQQERGGDASETGGGQAPLRTRLIIKRRKGSQSASSSSEGSGRRDHIRRIFIFLRFHGVFLFYISTWDVFFEECLEKVIQTFYHNHYPPSSSS